MTPRQEDGYSKAGIPAQQPAWQRLPPSLPWGSVGPAEPGSSGSSRWGCSGAPGGRGARDSAAIPVLRSPADQGDRGSEDELRRESGGPRSGDGPGIPVSVGAVNRVLCGVAPCSGRGSWKPACRRLSSNPSAADDAVTALDLVSKTVIKRIMCGAATFNPIAGTGSRK